MMSGKLDHTNNFSKMRPADNKFGSNFFSHCWQMGTFFRENRFDPEKHIIFYEKITSMSPKCLCTWKDCRKQCFQHNKAENILLQILRETCYFDNFEHKYKSSATLILREIDFSELIITKKVLLTFLQVLNFDFGQFLPFLKADFFFKFVIKSWFHVKSERQKDLLIPFPMIQFLLCQSW